MSGVAIVILRLSPDRRVCSPRLAARLEKIRRCRE